MTGIDIADLNSTIRAEMARRRVRQATIAKLLGLSPASVSARLGGYAEWRVSELQTVASHLGIRVTLTVTPETAVAS